MRTAKKKYHHGDLKEQLIDAVSGLVERDGPDGWSIAEACRLAGVSSAAPYRHFADRKDILHHTVMRAMENFHGEMRHAADSHQPGSPKRIVALGENYLRFARENPQIFRIMFGVEDEEGKPAVITETGMRARSVVEMVVADHLGIHPDSPEARLRAFSLWCFVHGYALLQLDARIGEGDEAIPEDQLLILIGEAIVPSGPEKRAP
ncbi:MAG: TetR/AcrR family transcriptional regulator [Pseudomonadota bacterium]